MLLVCLGESEDPFRRGGGNPFALGCDVGKIRRIDPGGEVSCRRVLRTQQEGGIEKQKVFQ